jgi:hypothetical protein
MSSRRIVCHSRTTVPSDISIFWLD